MKVVISHKKEVYADEIDEMVRRIAKRFDPDQIILFGSRARGTARHDSDVDLLVVMPVTEVPPTEMAKGENFSRVRESSGPKCSH